MKVKSSNFLLISLILVVKLPKLYCKRGPHHPRGEYSIKEKQAELNEHFKHENEHMEQDLIGMNVKHKDISEMTEEEKSFYYFKIHDTDNNDNLDGLEMLNAATHRHGHFHKLDRDRELQKMEDELNHIIGVIDDFIDFADLNKDGLLNYPEYIRALNANNDEDVPVLERDSDAFMLKD